MGFIFMVVFGIVVGLLFLAGWASVDAICSCVPMREGAAGGALGLFTIAGIVLGAIMQIACS